MTTKIKHIASNIITTTELDTSSLDSHFSGGTGVTYSGGAISIGQAVHSTDSPTFADLTITGNLNITGNIDQYNVTDLDVTDKTITLGSGQIEANSGGSGIIIDGSGASILWDETNTEWDFNTRINVPSAFSQYYSIRESGTQYGFIGQYKAITGTGTDTSLTIFSETGDGINFAVNGSVNKAVVIDNGGKVGIGTDSPTMPLSVKAASNAYAINMHGRSDGYSELYGSSSDGSTRYAFLQTHSAQTKLYTLVNTPLLFGTNSTERMRLSEGGALHLGSGHGTASPSNGVVAAAYASGYNNAGGDLEFYGGRSTGDNPGGEIQFFTGAAGSPGTQINSHSRRMTIDADGNVGIGQSNPNTLLHLTKGSTSSDVDYIKLEMGSWSGHTNYLKSLVWSDGSNNIAAIGAEYDGSKTNIHFHSQYSGGYNGTSTRTMSILGNGNVGIGTTGPETKLHVKGTGQFDMLTIERSASTPGVKFVSGADTAGTFGFQLMDNNEWWSGVYNGSSYDYWIQANTDVLRVKKPISSFTDSGTKQYSHLCTGSFYQSTGAIVIDTNIPGYNSTGNANMFSIKIRGYEYAVHGSIDMAIGGYVGENNHYSINYNGNYVPEGWVDSVQFCKNNTTGKLAIVLGSTAAAQRIEMAVVDFIQGFQNVNESYAKGWSISCLTSLSNYSNFSSAEPRISNPRPGFHAYLSSSTTFTAGTAARTLASTTYNRGSHYDTSNGRFTAPTDGVYHFDMALQMTSSSVNQTYISAEVRVNGGTRYIGGWYNKTTGGNNGTATYSAAAGSVTIPLGRGDYIEFICELSNTDTALGGLAGYTYLSGVQIG